MKKLSKLIDYRKLCDYEEPYSISKERYEEILDRDKEAIIFYEDLRDWVKEHIKELRKIEDDKQYQEFLDENFMNKYATTEFDHAEDTETIKDWIEMFELTAADL